jgi:hypothetical protein
MRTVVVSLFIVTALASASSAQTVPPKPTTDPAGLLGEPHMMEQSIAFAGRWLGDAPMTQRDGFYPELGNFIPGAGWISAGPGYRQRFMNRHVFIDGSAAISWRAFKMAQARFEVSDVVGGHLKFGAAGRWQDFTQMNYFGTGSASNEDAHSQYRIKDANIVGYAVLNANRWLAVSGTFGRVQNVTVSSASGPFRTEYANAQVAFPADPGMDVQPDYLHGGVSVSADTRDSAGRPTIGGLYRAAAAAYSDRDGGRYSFRRYEIEGEQFIPVVGSRWILAAHGWGTFTETSIGHEVPFYMAPSLGGSNTLRGYDEYRFTDRNLVLASAESRWALLRDLDVAAFFDAGNVAARRGDLNLHKTSWGGGVRLHSRGSMLLRADIAHSREGVQVFVSMSDSFRLERHARVTADVPFVP